MSSRPYTGLARLKQSSIVVLSLSDNKGVRSMKSSMPLYFIPSIVNGESITAISYLYISKVPKTFHYSYLYSNNLI